MTHIATLWSFYRLSPEKCPLVFRNRCSFSCLFTSRSGAAQSVVEILLSQTRAEETQHLVEWGRREEWRWPPLKFSDVTKRRVKQ